MANHLMKTTALGLIAACAFVGGAQAGGLERAGYNIDLLFDPGQYVFESGVVYVAPQRKLKNVNDTIAGTGGDLNTISGYSSTADETEGYWVPRIGFKANLADELDCMADYSQPWGAHTNPGAKWAGAQNNVETKINSDNYGLTCSYKFEAGPGSLRVIGGGFYQELSGFKESMGAAPEVLALAGFPGFASIGRLDLEASGYGWRIGLAYEIEEYALRASVVYNSEVDLDNISGTYDLRRLPTGLNSLTGKVSNIYGETAMPESIELKVQSGIAPNWLAFGSVKWTDWSQLQRIPLYLQGSTTEVAALELAYRDGWTINGGIGHKLSDKWSVAGSLTWDRGTSQGYGSQTDTWTFGAGVSYTPTENVEFRLASAISLLTSGSSGQITVNGVTYGEDVTYDFGTDLAAAVSTSLKVRF